LCEFLGGFYLELQVKILNSFTFFNIAVLKILFIDGVFIDTIDTTVGRNKGVLNEIYRDVFDVVFAFFIVTRYCYWYFLALKTYIS
jgi:hypothetical protein